MRKSTSILFFFILICSLHALGQNILIIDSLTFNPVPYSKVISNGTFFYSNENGEFSENIINSEKYTIQSIGYQSKSMNKNLEMDTIFLLPTSYNLDEITIKGETNFYFLGYHGLKHLFPHTFKGDDSTILATFIPFDGKRATIESVLLSLQDAKMKSYIVHLYSVGNNGLPGKKLFSRKVQQKNFQKPTAIDISNLKLQIPSAGLFIAFEWLEQKSDSEQAVVNMTRRLDSNITYICHKCNEINPQWFKFEASKSFTFNARFGFKMRSF